MSIEATYHSEVRFVRSAHSSKTGTTITLALPDSDELSKVAGFDGKRYMLALVEIGDDEQPAQRKPEPEPEKLKGGALAKLAGIWSNDRKFWHWAANEWGRQIPNEATAALFIRSRCEIGSRAELDSSEVAAERFQARIRGPFMKYMAVNGFTAPEYA